MKTSIKTLFAAVLTTVVLTSSAFASSDDQKNNITVLNQVKNITKLEVNGNVKVLLMQAPTESVKVYDSYYSKNALVQQQNGVLRISSFQDETLTVAVYVRNLSSVQLADNATIKTYGKVSFLTLDVILKDKSSADINASTVSLYTSVKDNATLTLSGTTEDHTAMLGSLAQMTTNQFIAANSSVNSLPGVVAKQKTESLPWEAIAELGK
ncbi:GIN domain-containing protein [Pedobacter insulae]|uniref:Putative auto-transporter adhesin head GIN domain-containing protein n=1 Tax=Pedobacter insulae TaxID=414048 RepID=A0A1I2T4Q9_9SPHI|nr:DUF2807 domain-containing protein [Pedobacter insulae]SFG57191.1 hypothetical protein SAMN04489864_10195 [Pedobacter insulae]